MWALEVDFYTCGRNVNPGQMLLNQNHFTPLAMQRRTGAVQRLPGVVGLMPRGAKRTLRYLHHAGIGLVLRKFD